MPGDFFVFYRAPDSANVGANGKGRGMGAPGRETATWAKRGGDVRKPEGIVPRPQNQAMLPRRRRLLTICGRPIGYAFGTKKSQEELVRIVQEAPILTEGAVAHADRFILILDTGFVQ